jgi:hypothetical protein
MKLQTLVTVIFVQTKAERRWIYFVELAMNVVECGTFQSNRTAF